MKVENLKMRYALIGCGRIAINHIQAVLNNKLELIAVCDIVPERMKNLLDNGGVKNKDGVKKYTDYRKMIADNDIDLIAIAIESGGHAKIALYCIDQGINVIIEKPMTMNMDDANEIIKKSEEKNIKVSVCHQNRFNKAIQETRKALEPGRFGKLSHGSINVRWNRNKDYYDQASWRGTWSQDGGTLMNQCIHGIDLLRWMMGGKIKKVYGITRQRFHHYLEAEDLGVAVVEFENGSVATIEGTVNVYPKNLEGTLYLFGEKGTVKVGGTSTNKIDVWQFADEVSQDSRNQNLVEEISNVYGNGHTSLYADMIDAIKNDRAPYVDAYAGRDAVELVLAIYKSQKEERPVELPLEEFSTLDMVGGRVLEI